MAVVLVEQFYDFAEELADAYTVMARGQVIAQVQAVKCLQKVSRIGWRFKLFYSPSFEGSPL